MAEKMTEQAVFDVLYEMRLAPRHQLEEAARRIVHLTQPAQSVDVGAEDRFEQYVKTLIDKAPDVQKLGERLAHWLDDDQFNNIEPTLLGIARAIGNAQAEGWKVLRFTGSAPRPGERWEVYGPDGSGGVVATQDVPAHVRGLLDALSPTPPQPEE